MGFYSFGRLKIISRNGVKSAVATAAYHAAVKLTNAYDGVTHDHTRKQNVEATFIRMPDSVPAAWRDETIPVEERLNLIWNTVETENTASNARLARSNYLALQNNLTMEQNLECVDRFIKENCTDQGMGVTYSVHLKDGNPHVDMMYLVSEYDKKGKPKAKQKKEYLCRNNAGEELYLSPEAFKSSEGYEKVYKYQKDGEKQNMTPSEASEKEGWERVNKNPVCRTIKVSGWDDQNLAKTWRKSWEVILNDKFQELGMPDRVDCRSYKERGLSHLPTVHEGWGPGKKEKAALNEQIREHNKEVDELFHEGMQAGMRIDAQIKLLQKYEQTEESLEEHEEMYQENESILHSLIDSGLMSQGVEVIFKQFIQNLGETFKELLNRVRERIAGERESEVSKAAEKAHDSLDNVLNNIRKQQPEKEKNPSGKNRNNNSWGDR